MTEALPLEDLTIYYIRGKIDLPDPFFGTGFLGNWLEDGDTFLFFSQPSDEVVRNALSRCPGADLIDRYEMSFEQWHGGRFEPVSIGNFFILPPWEKRCENFKTKRIILNPGVVFGTGLHPSTADCLLAMETLFEGGPVKSAMDLGTGTGILALAAAKCGCRQVLAADSHLIATKTAWMNIRYNMLEKRVIAVQARAEDLVGSSCELLISNIHFEIMEKMIADSAFLNHRWFILSGIFGRQVKKIKDALLEKGLKISREWASDGIWRTFLAERKT